MGISNPEERGFFTPKGWEFPLQRSKVGIFHYFSHLCFAFWPQPKMNTRMDFMTQKIPIIFSFHPRNENFPSLWLSWRWNFTPKPPQFCWFSPQTKRFQPKICVFFYSLIYIFFILFIFTAAPPPSLYFLFKVYFFYSLVA